MKNRSILNAIRITILDWDPMDLFMMGHAGLEEYDEYIAEISDAIKKFKTPDEMYDFLIDLSKDKMDVDADKDRTRVAAEKLLSFNLE